MSTKQHMTEGIQDFISDDSSFYGDDDVKERLEQTVEESWNSNATVYHSVHASETYVLGYKPKAHDEAARPEKKQEEELWNPYSHLTNAWQLGESVEDFLTRLPPSKSFFREGWIWVANPRRQRQPKRSDLAGFNEAAKKLFDQYTSLKDHIATSGYPRTKKAKADRDKLQHEILQVLAVKYDVLCGKWMLFPNAADVDRIWAVVAEAVVNDQLGMAAKVASADAEPTRSGKLICIYTKNFSDLADVRRVLETVFDLGLAKRDRSKDSRGIYYKADAYTHLGIESKNEWGLKASLYSSQDPPSTASRVVKKDDDWSF
ncbi:MAG: hypothetical protein M1828_004439 [Chrysothrix sp. TS-e1954]|nr:MAG: hypothetical protein M1828_004439 [Chrysothrix sp. TS-e1954]